MTSEWNAFLARQGLAGDGRHFGNPAAELAAARDGAVLAPLTDFTVIRASGADAAGFLHNLLTNDISGIDAKTARFAGFCTAKGRLLATLTIWRQGDDLLLMLPADVAGPVLKKLSMYVLRSKVTLAAAGNEVVLVGLKSPGAVPPAPTLPADLPVRGAADIEGGKLLRLDDRRWILALDPATAIAQWPGLAGVAHPVGTDAWTWLEIAAGQPRVLAGTQEAFVPQMINMEHAAVGGVSFTKGCYPGQEIVARSQYLGKVKRRMFRVRMPGPFAATTHVPGTPLYSTSAVDGHCGTVVTVAPSPDGGHEALICAQSAAVEAANVRLASVDGPLLTLLDLPYALPD